MRSARLATAIRGPMIAIALAVALHDGPLGAQPPPVRVHPGAILVQTMDTSINPLSAELVMPALGLALRISEEGAVLLLNVPDGLYLLQARQLGHRAEWRFVRVEGDTARVDFILAPVDVTEGAAAGSLAQARLRDFLRRTGVIPIGTFLTRAEIDRRRPRTLLALLGRVTDVTVERPTRGPSIVRSARALGPECASGMLIVVHPERPHAVGALGAVERSSLEREAGTIGPTWSTRRPASELDRIPISTVAGVEVYPTLAGVPPEFRVRGAECGVVLLWTTGK